MDGDVGSEAVAPSVQRFDAVLTPPAVANGLADHHQALRQDAFADEAIGPQFFDELLFGDDAVAVLEKIGEDIESVRLERAQRPGAA